MAEDKEPIKFEIYGGAGEMSSTTGYTNHTKGMVAFVGPENYYVACTGNSRNAAELIARSLALDISVVSKTQSVVFEFYDGPGRSIPIFMDGYFGRPLIGVGAIFLKPLQQRRRPKLIRELERIGEIADRKGRKIKLVA